jgi:hypothetical protein
MDNIFWQVKQADTQDLRPSLTPLRRRGSRKSGANFSLIPFG